MALVGYTNAGKSSILRALSGQHEIVVEDRLFATLDTLTREVDLGEGQRARVTDTVGFIRKLPHHLVASFRATLEEARAADVLLHVVDASHPDWEGQMRVVEKVLAELGLADRPMILVFNKIDAVADPSAFAARVRELHPDRAAHNDHADRRPRCAQGAGSASWSGRAGDGPGSGAAGRRRPAGGALSRRRSRSPGAGRRALRAGRPDGAWQPLARLRQGGARGKRRARVSGSRLRKASGVSGELGSSGRSVYFPPLSTCSRISQRFMPANFWCILVIGGVPLASSSSI